ncbi:MAG: ABC transporter permease [Gemmatimonadetes bacterium]|nr:ABC transporter permease [Gemmatimonadota bacterium]
MSHLLRVLLLLVPAPFRVRFGDEIREQIEADRHLARRRGRLALMRFDLDTAADLARTALTERISPSWEGHHGTDDGMGVGMMMMGWVRDLGLAGRSLARVPGFTGVAVLTLGLAMGAVAGLFSVVDTVLLQPLPYQHAERLVSIQGSAPGTDYPDEFGLGPAFFLQYRDGSTLLEDVALWDDFTNTVRSGDRTERLLIVAASNSLFRTLGTEPALGRLPTENDQGDVAVLSHAMWRDWFGEDPEAVGRSIFAAGADRTIVGVMGPNFWFPYEGVDLWLPNPIREEGIDPSTTFSGVIARTGPDVEADALVAELGRLASRIPERFGASPGFARVMERHRPVVRSMDEDLLGDVSTPLWILLGSVGIVLLIACANVANLFLVRVAHRARDMAVRAALGAGWGRRARILMAEAVVIAGAAGAVAVTLAWVGVPLLVQAAPQGLPRLADAAVTPTTLAFTLVLCTFTALACGVAPALRGSGSDLARLRDGSRGSTGRAGRARDVLVAGQTALALVLLVGSALLMRSFVALNRVDPGYETTDIFAFQMAPDRVELSDGPTFARFYDTFQERLAALPGVESVGMVENLPLDEGLSMERFVPAGSDIAPTDAPLISFTFADADYFGTMGISVVQGRLFTPEEEMGSGMTALLSESAAELLWPGRDPVGERLRAAEGQTLYTVIGVVEDILQYNLRQRPDPMLYLPRVGPTPESWVLASPAQVVRTGRAELIEPEVRALVRELAPEAPMYRAYTMRELAEGTTEQLSFTLLTLGITSALALFLGAVGLFGVLSYTVTQRTREIGVRMALGADAGRVRWMVVGQGVRVVLVGVTIGLVVALVSTRALEGLLYGVESGDGVTFATVALGMTAVGLLASWLPAWRASRVEPVESLKEA